MCIEANRHEYSLCAVAQALGTKSPPTGAFLRERCLTMASFRTLRRREGTYSPCIHTRVEDADEGRGCRRGSGYTRGSSTHTRVEGAVTEGARSHMRVGATT